MFPEGLWGQPLFPVGLWGWDRYGAGTPRVGPGPPWG